MWRRAALGPDRNLAIARSAAREVGEGVVPARLAAQAILVAFAVNTLVKVGFTRIWGSRALFARVAWPLGAGAALAVAWVVGFGWLAA